MPPQATRGMAYHTKRETNNLIWRIVVACRYDLCSRNTYVQCFSQGLRSSAVTEAVTLPLTFGSDGTEAHMSVTKSPWSGLQRSFSLLTIYHISRGERLLVLVVGSWSRSSPVPDHCSMFCSCYAFRPPERLIWAASSARNTSAAWSILPRCCSSP